MLKYKYLREFEKVSKIATISDWIMPQLQKKISGLGGLGTCIRPLVRSKSNFEGGLR